jgi:uncharacterized protein (TIGR02186 family)
MNRHATALALSSIGWLGAVLWLSLGADMAQAEKIVVSLSNHRVAINSNFSGEDLVLFGAIQPDTGAQLRDNYDVVVTATGPRQSYYTRRKARVLGIWVNVNSREFVGVPSYLAVLSNRHLTRIASPDELRRLQIGLDNYLLPQRIGPDIADTVRDDPFRAAFVSIQGENGLYTEDPVATTFITPNVFRVGVPIPSQIPTGAYDLDIKLFSGGSLLAQTKTTLDITKAGFEQYIADAARDHGLLYGLASALLALLTGWIASVVFRRD